jgi:hypothetical protein
MKFSLYTEIILLQDIPQKKLRRGDIATIVDHHPAKDSEDGYTLEIFNALGETLTTVTVAESAIESLKENQVLSVRSIEAA